MQRMQRSDFVSTHWSIVLAASGRSTPEGAAAFSALCGIYWRPLYAYVRRRGLSIEDAQDLTQSFFCRLMEKDALQHAEPERGRFRSFLLTSLKNFQANEWDRQQTQKRGGHVEFLSLDEIGQAENDYLTDETACILAPEVLYERNWALALLKRTTSRLAAEFAGVGKAGVFENLKSFLTGESGGMSYSQAAASLGMSEGAVRVAVHRLRGRFRDLLRAEIALTVANPEDPHAIEEELRHLLSVL